MARRLKRSFKEDNMWDCSVCTYRNSAEAFKCLMCDVRKGTSTRKPRLNAELVAAQVAQVVPKVKKSDKKDHKERKVDEHTGHCPRPRLKNVDRSTAEHNTVTVNNVTVIITEFQPKQRKAFGSQSVNGDNSYHMSSSEAGSISDASTDTRNGELTETRS